MHLLGILTVAHMSQCVDYDLVGGIMSSGTARTSTNSKHGMTKLRMDIRFVLLYLLCPYENP